MRRNLFLAAGFFALTFHAFGADYAEAGALAKDGKWEVGVVFNASISRDSAIQLGNYSIAPAAEIESLRHVPLNNSVVLTVSNLDTNSNYTLSLTNLQDSAGSELPALELAFIAKPMSWTAVGGQELGFTPDAIAVGDGGFDLISGGIEMWNRYDESTFAYEPITGNFDKRVRIASQEGSSPAARAGLMVRESLDSGKARPINPFDPAEAFSRYIQVQVNPVTTAYQADGEPVPGNNTHQVNVRYFTGGIGSPNFFESTENPELLNNAAPEYPDAWLRLRREGQTFYVFRGTDGTNWTHLGTFTFPQTDVDGNPVPPFSQTAYVGPNYSPETGNIPESSGARRAFLARFRDYSDASGDIPNTDPATLTIVRDGNEVEISWTGSGTLQTTTDLVSGEWTDLGTTNPQRANTDVHHRFFRVRTP